MREKREFDIVVYGASGFTGRLVAEYLAGRKDATTRWAMAGRDTAKLAAVRDEIGAPKDIPLIAADASNPQSLRDMARRALQNAVNETSRMIRTGQVQSDATMTPQKFRDMVCERISILLACDENLKIDVREFTSFGGTGFSDFFEQVFGSRRAGGSRPQNDFGGGESTERGRDIEGDIMVTLDEAMRGSVRAVNVKHAVECENCAGSGAVARKKDRLAFSNALHPGGPGDNGCAKCDVSEEIEEIMVGERVDAATEEWLKQNRAVARIRFREEVFR